MLLRVSGILIRNWVRRHSVAAVATAIMLLPSGTRAADPQYDSGGTGTAERLLSDSDRAAYHGRFTEAIDDDTKALALSPSYAEAFAARAAHYMEAGRYAEAASDLDRATAMHPDAMWLALGRAQLAVRRADGAEALADVKAALKLPLLSAWHQPREAGPYESHTESRFLVTSHMATYAVEFASIAEQLQHQDDAALADMDRMLKLEEQYPEYALASYCYNAGVAGLLEEAEMACQSSIEHNSHDIGQYDSLGFVHLKMKQWDKAIADYNKALYGRSDMTTSLYGRGIAKRARGDVAGGNADMEAATKMEPDIANIMKRLGAPVV